MAFVSHSAEVLAALNAAIADAVDKCGAAAEEYARGAAPEETGALKESIGHTTSGATVTIGSSASYAVYVELGTSDTPGRPFIRPALEDHAGEYQNIITDALKNA